MSHLIATSIVITKDEIILKGGSNNVFPREHHEIHEPRTPENLRIFVRDLLGGCIKPRTSANDYFWWWLMRRGFWSHHTYDEDNHALDRLVEEVMDEYDKRRSRNGYTIYFADDEGKFVTYVEEKKGLFYLTKKPQRMPLYHASFLRHKNERWRFGEGLHLACGEIAKLRNS